MLRIPVSMGRNVAILVEVAARNHLLKRMGVYAAQAFTATLGGNSTAPDSPVASRDAEEPA
jgi:serine kinase of HPr protein (carbohydrate metabolism regulator)